MAVGITENLTGSPECIGVEDTAIVVDALRASSTVAALLEVGAREVIPVAEVPEKGFEDAVLAGEEKGEPLPCAALGNSPTEVKENSEELEGKKVVLRTTNGTRCVQQVSGACRVYTGGIVNLSTLVDEVDRVVEEGDIWVVPAGRRGNPAPEDTYTSKRIVSELCDRGRDPSSNSVPKVVKEEPERIFGDNDTGRFLRSTGRSKDVEFCASEDVFEVAPVLRDGSFVASSKT